MSEEKNITDASKNFMIKVAVLCGAILLTLGLGTCGYTKYQDYRVEQLALKKEKAHKDDQAAVRAMLTLCDFNHLKPEEQETIDKCGDDAEAAKQAIQNIVSARVVFWTTELQDSDDRAGKLMAIKNNADYWTPSNEANFKEVGAKILADNRQAKEQKEFWLTTRRKLTDYQIGSESDTPTNGKPKA